MSEWRVDNYYQIHVYDGNRSVASFHIAADAKRAVQAVNGSNWRPIETAPTDDGARILGWNGWQCVIVYLRVSYNNKRAWVEEGYGEQRLTHWMPIPEPPREI